MRVIKSGIALLIATVLTFGNTVPVRADASGTDAAKTEVSEPTIEKNITIDGVDVSGMTYDEALSKLGGDSEKRAKITVNLKSAYGDAKTTLGDIGYTNDAPQVVEEAIKIGNSGNILRRYKEEKELEKKPLELKVTRSVNSTRLNRVIQEAIGETLHQDAQYNLTKHDDGTVSVTMGGGNVDADSKATADAIGEILNNNWGGGAISAEIVIGGEDEERQAQVAEIKDLLGTFTTDYNGPSGRMANVERAANLCDGYVVFPGDVFSVTDHISPITEDNGYYMAHVYIGNKIVDGVGGGVCQVATTLYNAVLYAELEIVERDCHNLLVSYVDAAYDATIASGSIDFRFKNSSDYPIYVESILSDGELTFNIWGKETRPSLRTDLLQNFGSMFMLMELRLIQYV